MKYLKPIFLNWNVELITCAMKKLEKNHRTKKVRPHLTSVFKYIKIDLNCTSNFVLNNNKGPCNAICNYLALWFLYGNCCTC